MKYTTPYAELVALEAVSVILSSTGEEEDCGILNFCPGVTCPVELPPV